jgi:hypothetical protein
MAQKVQVILVDDLDGGVAAETVPFALDGVSYEIDLSDDNARKMRDAFAPYVGTARKVSARSSSARGRARSGSRDSRTSEIRAWARSNGHTVNERGRIAAPIVEAYERAHG